VEVAKRRKKQSEELPELEQVPSFNIDSPADTSGAASGFQSFIDENHPEPRSSEVVESAPTAPLSPGSSRGGSADEADSDSESGRNLLREASELPNLADLPSSTAQTSQPSSSAAGSSDMHAGIQQEPFDEGDWSVVGRKERSKDSSNQKEKSSSPPGFTSPQRLRPGPKPGPKQPLPATQKRMQSSPPAAAPPIDKSKSSWANVVSQTEQLVPPIKKDDSSAAPKTPEGVKPSQLSAEVSAFVPASALHPSAETSTPHKASSPTQLSAQTSDSSPPVPLPPSAVPPSQSTAQTSDLAPFSMATKGDSSETDESRRKRKETRMKKKGVPASFLADDEPSSSSSAAGPLSPASTPMSPPAGASSSPGPLSPASTPMSPGPLSPVVGPSSPATEMLSPPAGDFSSPAAVQSRPSGENVVISLNSLAAEPQVEREPSQRLPSPRNYQSDSVPLQNPRSEPPQQRHPSTPRVQERSTQWEDDKPPMQDKSTQWEEHLSISQSTHHKTFIIFTFFTFCFILIWTYLTSFSHSSQDVYIEFKDDL